MSIINSFVHKGTTFSQVNTMEQLCECLHIRYKVYCEEIGFNVKDVDMSYFSDMLFAKSIEDRFEGKYEFDKNDCIEDYLSENPLHVAHFIAQRKGKATGTIRIIEDSEDGLPMEPDYILDAFRDEGEKIAEVSRLINTGKCSDIMGLFRCVMQYARQSNITDIFATTQPEGLDLYGSICLYQVDKAFEYTKLGGKWIPLRMDVNRVFALSPNTVKYMCSKIAKEE